MTGLYYRDRPPLPRLISFHPPEGIPALFDPDAPYERRLPPWTEVVAALPLRAMPQVPDPWEPAGQGHGVSPGGRSALISVRARASSLHGRYRGRHTG